MKAMDGKHFRKSDAQLKLIISFLGSGHAFSADFYPFNGAANTPAMGLSYATHASSCFSAGRAALAESSVLSVRPGSYLHFSAGSGSFGSKNAGRKVR
jgi:hypothetical protein